MKSNLRKDPIMLRAPEPEDVDLLYDWENEPSLWHLSNTRTPFSRFDLEQYILNSEKDIYQARQARFMIILQEEGGDKGIGTVDLFDFDPYNKRAGIGILIVEGYRKKGFAGKTLDIILDYCKNQLGMHQLYCNITEGNDSSTRLFENKGFRRIGTKKEWALINQQWQDENMFQLIFREKD
ncbi:MAG: GNAT family protein [Bacteroidota bacterium]|nr:GNAT family protein [Bacteroidota bacterium]